MEKPEPAIDCSEEPPMINADLFQAIVEYLEFHQLSLTDELLKEREDYLDCGKSEIYLPQSLFVSALKLAERKLEDPLVALRCGSFTTSKHWGFLGYLLQSSNATGEAIELLKKFSRLLSNQFTFTIRDSNREKHLVIKTTNGHFGDDLRYVFEYIISSILNFAFNWTSVEELVITYHFPWNCPIEDTMKYEQLLLAPCVFNSKEFILQISNNALDRDLNSNDPKLKALMLEKTQELYDLSIMQDLLLHRIKDRIIINLTKGVPSIKVICEEVGVSESTLRRRLLEKGVSYQHLLDSTRHELAISLLRETTFPLCEISARLGFSEQSAFQRAFKRWTGSTPLSYRQS